ncbi:uncharacterized [Tachysurus ichikawai]
MDRSLVGQTWKDGVRRPECGVVSSAIELLLPHWRRRVSHYSRCLEAALLCALTFPRSLEETPCHTNAKHMCCGADTAPCTHTFPPFGRTNKAKAIRSTSVVYNTSCPTFLRVFN